MVNLIDLTGRTILVTGASSGIGRETAHVLSCLGAKVVLVARNAGKLSDAATGLEGDGHVVLPCDLEEFDAIAPMVKRAAEQAGALHGLVHCAGVQVMRPLSMFSAEQVDKTLRLNVGAALGLVRALAAPGMSRRPASVVLMSSTMGLVGQPVQSIYSASKGALVAMARSLALELARQQIRVNCVAASLVRAGMGKVIEQSLSPEQFAAVERLHPLGLGEASDVGNAIAFLLSDAARWITGTTLVVDGGYTAQ